MGKGAQDGQELRKKQLLQAQSKTNSSEEKKGEASQKANMAAQKT